VALRANRTIAAGLLLALGATVFLGLTRERASATTAQASAKAKTRLVTSTSLTLSQANQNGRLEAVCPKGKSPYGGGMTVTPPPGPDGEGVYPHSFERLGVQHGFHVSSVLFDPAAPTTSRGMTVQAVCGPDPGKVTSVRALTQVAPGASQNALATCPGKKHLIGGGFQQTDFTSKGGSFAAQSQAIGNKAWSVTAAAFGTSGGPAMATAYCVSGKSSFQEVSGSAAVGPGATATATTQPCPGAKRLVSDGFATSPAGAVLFAGGTINPDQSFSASGYNRSTAPATISAYAYCMRITPPPKKK
jgi:hypothetical protein